jgi:hypothetical protein
MKCELTTAKSNATARNRSGVLGSCVSSSLTKRRLRVYPLSKSILPIQARIVHGAGADTNRIKKHSCARIAAITITETLTRLSTSALEAGRLSVRVAQDSVRLCWGLLVVPILGTEVTEMSDLSEQNPAVHGGSIKRRTTKSFSSLFIYHLSRLSLCVGFYSCPFAVTIEAHGT